jgi:hypothetical protein
MAGADEKFDVVAKYRTTTKLKDALNIIAPDPKHREKCKYEIATALWGIEWAAKIDKGKLERTAAQYRRPLQNLAKTPQRAINLTAKAIPPEYLLEPDARQRWIENPFTEALKRHLKETEQIIIWNDKRVRKGSQRVKLARTAAVDSAFWLLRRYDKRPTRSREGDWHKLAGVLLGKEEADLFRDLKRRHGVLVRVLEQLKSEGG